MHFTNSSNNFENSSYSKENTYNTFNKTLKEEYYFSPDINKKLNKAMFDHSPLINDELLNKRIKCLRDINFKKIVDNYEKNNREILSKNKKKDKNILNKIISEEKKYMKLDIEKKNNKDKFDNFNIYNSNEYLLDEPLFIVEIKI